MSDDKPTFISIRIGTRKKLKALGKTSKESYDEIINIMLIKLAKKWIDLGEKLGLYFHLYPFNMCSFFNLDTYKVITHKYKVYNHLSHSRNSQSDWSYL